MLSFSDGVAEAWAWFSSWLGKLLQMEKCTTQLRSVHERYTSGYSCTTVCANRSRAETATNSRLTSPLHMLCSLHFHKIPNLVTRRTAPDMNPERPESSLESEWVRPRFQSLLLPPLRGWPDRRQPDFEDSLTVRTSLSTLHRLSLGCCCGRSLLLRSNGSDAILSRRVGRL